ncbi:uncharacterized protein AKAME5_002003400 [Lates japonicus]|uniref:Uncharacterized protein n=1 Tax=Lates japonicus TaxID=270547 RepID=A0AAD3NCC9_LATJO|nr:uncharacterized protein AKAME5_002003400 [Lates japonicus]
MRSVHCGYLFLLFLGLWAELAAGRALSTAAPSSDPEVQSIIEDLQVALQNYSSVLKETNSLKDLPVQPCTETTAHLGQSSTLANKLSRYQVCAEQLGSFCPDVSALCRVVMLNQDLLQHLDNSHEDSAGCPSSSSSSTPDFNAVRKSMQCVQCWSQQVAALRR